MPGANDTSAALDVTRLLAGAAKTIRNVRYCWLATATPGGAANVRPMQAVLHDVSEDKDAWTIRFLTDGRSRKVADIRRTGQATIVFQDDADVAFVALSGRATLFVSEAEVRKYWKHAYDAFFPTEADRIYAAFVEVDVARMELWIRGVTPEPFGMRTTILERVAGRGWRVMSQ